MTLAHKVIGKVTKINTNIIEAELLEGAESHVINSFDDIYRHSLIESFVGIQCGEDLVIAEVIGLREKDFNNITTSAGEYQGSKHEVLRYIDLAPVGTLIRYPFTRFELGVSKFPQIYSNIICIEKSELDVVFNVLDATPAAEGDSNTILNYLPIGRSSSFPEYEIKININNFFGAHSAVLGNTGSGKSCTISSMIQRLFKKKDYAPLGASFIFFDINGEYVQALESLNKDVHANCLQQFSFDDKDKKAQPFYLPHWYLSVDEWALLLRASERTQKPVLRTALGMSSFLEGNEAASKELKNHIVASCIVGALSTSTSPVSTTHVLQTLLTEFPTDDLKIGILTQYSFNAQYGNFPGDKEQQFIAKMKTYIKDAIDLPAYNNKKFDFNKLGDYLNLSILYEESHGNKQIRDYCSQMLTRYKSLKDRKEYDFLKQPENSSEISDYIDHLLGLRKKKGKISKISQISVIDMNVIEDEIVELVSSVLSRLVFERLRKSKNRNKFPVNLVLEEAHRYISQENIQQGEASRIFERIAKEGRKYGLFILLSSQRPYELSKTVLSQCSNFIVHRILNPEDLLHIKRITPSISEAILNRLPSLPTRHALIFGSATNLPAVFKVNKADPKPKSDNNNISKNWFVPADKQIDI